MHNYAKSQAMRWFAYFNLFKIDYAKIRLVNKNMLATLKYVGVFKEKKQSMLHMVPFAVNND